MATPSLLALILPAIQHLLSDSQPGVVKRTLQAGRLLMPEVMRQLLQVGDPSPLESSNKLRGARYASLRHGLVTYFDQGSKK